MDIADVVQSVCRMPSDYRRLGNRSMVDLIRASGYIENHDAVSESKLRQALEANPDLIQAWLSYCGDQKTSEGHYLLDADIDGRPGWVVGHVPDGKDERFSDGPTACARYVKLEAEALRRISAG